MLSRLALTLREVLLAVLLMRAAVSQRLRLQAGLPRKVLTQKVLLQRAGRHRYSACGLGL